MIITPYSWHRKHKGLLEHLLVKTSFKACGRDGSAARLPDRPFFSGPPVPKLEVVSVREDTFTCISTSATSPLLALISLIYWPVEEDHRCKHHASPQTRERRLEARPCTAYAASGKPSQIGAPKRPKPSD